MQENLFLNLNKIIKNFKKREKTIKSSSWFFMTEKNLENISRYLNDFSNQKLNKFYYKVLPPSYFNNRISS